MYQWLDRAPRGRNEAGIWWRRDNEYDKPASSPPNIKTGQSMKDMKAHLEKLRVEAAECALIRDLATDPKKRELFTRLAEHLQVLASEVERAIAAGSDQKTNDACRAIRVSS
jgi:hypothetical protein